MPNLGRSVRGYQPTREETALFDQACRYGALTIPPDLPVSSILPKVWRVHCDAAKAECLVRELTLKDVGA